MIYILVVVVGLFIKNCKQAAAFGGLILMFYSILQHYNSLNRPPASILIFTLHFCVGALLAWAASKIRVYLFRKK